MVGEHKEEQESVPSHHPLMVAKTVPEATRMSAPAIRDHAQSTATGALGEPGHHAQERAAEGHRREFDFAPIPGLPMVEIRALGQTEKRNHAMRIPLVQFLVAGLSGVAGMLAQSHVAMECSAGSERALVPLLQMVELGVLGRINKSITATEDLARLMASGHAGSGGDAVHGHVMVE